MRSLQSGPPGVASASGLFVGEEMGSQRGGAGEAPDWLLAHRGTARSLRQEP